MTPKQILDSFSETLVQDDRILSASERALIAGLVHHAKTATGSNPELQEAVRKVIASAIGETVAQRAFSVLGSSIVERLVESGAIAEGSTKPTDLQSGVAGSTARPVWLMPTPPAPSPGPQTPSSPKRAPLEAPKPPSPSGPQTPSIVRETAASRDKTVTALLPERLNAQCVVLDEFLAPQELADLTQFTLDHQSEFETSEVLSPSAEDGVVNYDHRRSRVLMALGKHQDLILDRIKSVLPDVLEKLGMQEFAIRDVEAQITASNDGDFFHFHNDNGNAPVSSRHLTFVYFFHREPKRFEGGELRIHDARLHADAYVSEGTYQTIKPQQNQIVFFPCELMHEITTVECPSKSFADSRFTLNGWLRH
ncbi:MAG TPA: 2OG-Fe(II) oxygenase [Candidatus Eisenbacteria bacterium]|nr:2OG-Fe(II) oxygenase [Candidatus Eisenbacteria bacterium]